MIRFSLNSVVGQTELQEEQCPLRFHASISTHSLANHILVGCKDADSACTNVSASQGHQGRSPAQGRTGCDCVDPLWKLAFRPGKA